MTPDAKEKLSASLKAKWASGTRKKTPDSAYVKSSVSLKRAHAEGRMHKVTYEASMRGLAARDMNKVRAAARLVAIAGTGRSMPAGPGAKGPNHWKAKYYRLRTPQRQIIEGWNLVELIRKNEHLFHADDVKWYSPKGGKHTKGVCRALKGLRQLFEIRKNGKICYTWKGWTNGDRLDHGPGRAELSSRADTPAIRPDR